MDQPPPLLATTTTTTTTTMMLRGVVSSAVRDAVALAGFFGGGTSSSSFWGKKDDGNDGATNILWAFLVLACASFVAHEALHAMSARALPSRFFFGAEKWARLAPHRRAQVLHAPNQILNGLVAGTVVETTRFPSEMKKNGKFDVGTRTTKRGVVGKFITKVLGGGGGKRLGNRKKAALFKRSTIVAMAASCGYLMYDFLLLTIFDRKNMLRAHGRRQYAIYVFHHLLPLLMWPLALHHGTFEYFVAWGVRSELSQAAMGLRTICIGMGILDTAFGVIVQLSFVGLFFWVRMWPLLDNIVSIAKADWFAENVPRWQVPFAWMSVPLPLILNVYWWFMIMGAFWKVVSGEKKRKKEA